MSNKTEVDLALQIEEPVNDFLVVHIHNKRDIYHLTRQVLIDSALIQDTCGFFYHIVSMKSRHFNTVHGSYACMIERSQYEADIYMNVNIEALSHIIDYVQTGKIVPDMSESQKDIEDMASMFGMPGLVHLMRETTFS